MGEDVHGFTGMAVAAAEGQTNVNRGWKRWKPVISALTAIEAAAQQAEQEQQVVDPIPTPPPKPEMSDFGGATVTEGGNAVFTLTGSQAPAAALRVSVILPQPSDYAAAGSRTLTIPVGPRFAGEPPSRKKSNKRAASNRR